MFESLIPDGIFQAGETWEFVIDDYINVLGLLASAFGSCAPMVFPCIGGLVGGASGGDLASSGSIIVVPEPSTGLLLAVGIALLVGARRRLSWLRGSAPAPAHG